MQVLVTCPFGLSSLLSKELKRLQLKPHTTLDTAVLLDTDQKGRYAINLWSRIANKVYLILEQKEILSFDQLFDAVVALDWWNYLPSNAISVQVTAKHSQLSSQRTIQSIVHKAILTKLSSAQWTEEEKKNFSFENEERSHEIFIHIEQNQARICINTSGASLHQRGWRTQTGPAPLKENIAAAMVLLSWWRFKAPLIDPCCGSGTLLIEAAMIAKNIAPWLQRTFDFQHFPSFDQQIWNMVVHKARESIYTGSYQLIGRDRDATVLAFAQKNAENAGVNECISREQQEVLDSTIIFPEDFRLLSNPPYGKRLSESEELFPLYKKLAGYLREGYGGIISSYPEMKNLFSVKKFSHKQLYNGADKVDFYRKKL